MKGYVFKIYPDDEQKALFSQHFGCVRHVYNWGLEQKERHYKETGKGLSKRALQDLMVASKADEKPWLNEVNSQSLLASLGNLDKAFSNFFKGLSKYPAFKKKYAGWQSFQCPQFVTVDFGKGCINLPKIKGIKAKLHRSFAGKIKTVTIKRTPTGEYFASLLVDDGEIAPTPTTVVPEQTLGLDLGLSHFLIDSQGNKTDNQKFLRSAAGQLAAAQKIFSRMKKDSRNRAKQKLKVAIIHRNVANKRSDFIHQATANLAFKNHATSFAVENLNIKGMVKNRRLARAINDASWGRFITVLGYKCEWQGKNVLPIGRFQPSSKLCSNCGHKLDKLPLSVRSWTCPSCGIEHDRDINAANNIKGFALADALGRSVCVKSSPAKLPVSAGFAAKDAGFHNQHGSQEAPTTAPCGA